MAEGLKALGAALRESPRISDVSEILSSPRSGKERIDYIARRIRELGAGNSPQHVLRLGELVYRELRAGDQSLAGRDQRASLRRIAAHPDVPFKVTTIWRAVSVYEMSLRLPHLLEAPELGVSHLRAVIGLAPADQELLLTLAARERWTKRRLEQEAARRRSSDSRKGRRPLPKLTLWTRELERLVERSLDWSESDLALSASGVSEFQDILTRFRQRASEIEVQISRLSASGSASGASVLSDPL